MRFLSRIRRLFANLLEKEKVEHQLDQELRAYVDMVTDEKIAAVFPHPKRAEARWLILVDWSR
jgi:hypothetical protein